VRPWRLASVQEQATNNGTRTFSYRDSSDLQLATEDLPGFFGTSRRLTRTYETTGAPGRYAGLSYGPTSGTAQYAATYTYQGTSGRLDTVVRSGYVNMTYGYVGGSDHVGSVGGGGWLRSQAWETGREAVSTVTQSWNGGTLLAHYTSDYDWRLNRDAVTLTGTLASQQGHAGG